MDQKYSLQRSAAMLRDSEDDSRYSVSFARTPLFRVMGPVNIVVSRDDERRFKSTVIPEEHDEGGEREEKKGKGKRREAERERSWPASRSTPKQKEEGEIQRNRGLANM